MITRLLTFLVIVTLAGCERTNNFSGDTNSGNTLSMMRFAEADTPAPANTLARSHRVSVDVERENLNAAHARAEAACNATKGCDVLHSSVSSGDYPRGHLNLRLNPEDVPDLIKTASEDGDIVEQSTSAEDLAKPIFDQETRLAQLRQYLDELTALRQTAKNDVDALIRVAGEISRTQSQLEAAEGQRAYLQQRVDTETLNIDFVVDTERGFLAPIANALSEFTETLGDGIGNAILGAAFILPWLAILLPIFYLVLYLWRRSKRKHQ